jgi:RNA-directed DNA polymerase
MTKAGYRLTRFADDFVVVCNTRQEAEAALALASKFLQEELGVSLHPEKTRIVHCRFRLMPARYSEAMPDAIPT